MDTLWIFGGAVCAGLLAGFLGLGGGVLIVPALALFGDISMKQAAGISLTASIATSMASSTVFIKKHLCDLDLGLKLALTATAGGLSGGILSTYVSNAHLAFIFAAFILYSGISLAFKKDHNLPPIETYARHKLALFLFVAYIAGLLSGLLGVGGGIIFVPLMFLGLKFPIQRATGTSAFVVGLTATGGAVIYFLRGELDNTLDIVPAVVMGMIAGGKLGGILGVKTKSRIVRQVFAGLLFFMCYRMVKLGMAG